MRFLKRFYRSVDKLGEVKGKLAEIQRRRAYWDVTDPDTRYACEKYDSTIIPMLRMVVRDDGKSSLFGQVIIYAIIGVVCLVCWPIELVVHAGFFATLITFGGGIAALVAAFTALQRLYKYLLEADQKVQELIRDEFLERQYGAERVRAAREARRREAFIQQERQRQTNRYRRNRQTRQS